MENIWGKEKEFQCLNWHCLNAGRRDWRYNFAPESSHCFTIFRLDIFRLDHLQAPNPLLHSKLNIFLDCLFEIIKMKSVYTTSMRIFESVNLWNERMWNMPLFLLLPISLETIRNESSVIIVIFVSTHFCHQSFKMSYSNVMSNNFRVFEKTANKNPVIIKVKYRKY